MKILKVIIFFIFIILTSPIKFGFAEDKYLSQCIEQADVGDKMNGKTYDQVETTTAENICLKAYSIDKENIKIIRSLGRIYHIKKEFKKSLSFFKKAIDKNDAYSMYMASDMYFEGHGVNPDKIKAFSLIKKSAELKNPSALSYIGDYYGYGYGTEKNYKKALESFQNCAELNDNYCLYKMAWIFQTGQLNQKINFEKMIFYVDKLIENKSPDGYYLMGTHLIENAKSKREVRNGLLYCKSSEGQCDSSLINYYLFPEDYPLFYNIFSDRSKNKAKAIELLLSILKRIDDDNSLKIPNTINVQFIADVLTGSYYTKILSDKDIQPILKKFKQIANNKNENYNNSISNIASTSLGDFYHLGLYTEKDLNTSQKYYGLAAHRNDFDAAISAGWVNFLNEDYDKSKYYNDLVIKNSNDPFVRAFAFNNNGVVDSEVHGAGTNYQLEQWEKSAELVLNYNYRITWPITNLFRLYYLPIHNTKKENGNLQNYEKAKEYYDLTISIQEKYKNLIYEDISYWGFILKNFRRVPKTLEEAVGFLEYAALNGYYDSFAELAWLNEGHKKKDNKLEVYKWNYMCTIFGTSEDRNDQCQKDLIRFKKKVSFYDRDLIEKNSANWIGDQTKRIAELKKKLKPINNENKPNNKFDYGNYHALLIGVNEYENFQDLRTPINDVNRLNKILSTKYKFKAKKIINPSRRDLLKEINNYTKLLNANDNLIIYFAGHGMQKSDEGFWLTSEAEKDDDIDWVSNNTIVRKLREIKANNILVVADSCFSGLLTRGLNFKNDNINKSPLEILHKSKSRIAITSGGNEPVLDGGGGKNSIFAASLASELENRSEPFTASELFLNIQKKVIKETLAFGIKQSPIILDIPKSGHENFDFVFNPN